MSISHRGKKAVQPALSYFGKFLEGSCYLYDKEERPDGYVLLAVAENRQTSQHMAEKLELCRGIDPGVTAYANMCGRERFRQAVATLMSSTAVKSTVDPSKLVVGSGCGGLINELAFLLADAGQSCLLPTPTYGALYNDFNVLAGVKVVDVPTEGSGYKLTVPALEAAHAGAISAGHPPALLFLINPCNPLGTVYPAEDMAAAIAWARSKGLHTVVDEIYANGVWDTSTGPSFTSAVDLTPLGNDLHVLWGMSKDFALSGYRTGVLYTHNATLLEALGNTSYLHSVSNDTQDTLARMCQDVAWVKGFFARAQRDCRESYAIVRDACEAMGVPHLPAHAGMFAWLDLRQLLHVPGQGAGQGSPASTTSWDVVTGQGQGQGADFTPERELVDRLWAECHLLFTPGEACHAREPGFFRCCFAWMPRDALVVGMARLREYVARHKGRAGSG
jgi:aspartate/methionine/tyrosine aminotransferase